MSGATLFVFGVGMLVYAFLGKRIAYPILATGFVVAAVGAVLLSQAVQLDRG